MEYHYWNIRVLFTLQKNINWMIISSNRVTKGIQPLLSFKNISERPLHYYLSSDSSDDFWKHNLKAWEKRTGNVFQIFIYLERIFNFSFRNSCRARWLYGGSYKTAHISSNFWQYNARGNRGCILVSSMY